MKILGLFLGFSLWTQTSFAIINFIHPTFSSNPYCHDNQYVYFKSLTDCIDVGAECSGDLKAGPLKEVESIYISETEKLIRLYLFPGFSGIPQCADRELKKALFIESSRFAYSEEVGIIQNLLKQNVHHVGLYGTRFVIPKSLKDEDFTVLKVKDMAFSVYKLPYVLEDDESFEIIAAGGEYGGGGITTNNLNDSHNISIFESEIELWKSEDEDSEPDSEDEGVEI